MILLAKTEDGKLFILKNGNMECKPWGINTSGENSEVVKITSFPFSESDSFYEAHYSAFSPIEGAPFESLDALLEFVTPCLGFKTTPGGSGVLSGTTEERDNFEASVGTTFYNTDCKALQVKESAEWVNVNQSTFTFIRDFSTHPVTLADAGDGGGIAEVAPIGAYLGIGASKIEMSVSTIGLSSVDFVSVTGSGTVISTDFYPESGVKHRISVNSDDPFCDKIPYVALRGSIGTEITNGILIVTFGYY